MTPFEHLFVLFSIILGLGLTELLTSLHHLMHPRTRVKWHWLPLVWSWQVFHNMVFWWWAVFTLTDYEFPNFLGMMILLMGPVFLYLLGTSLLPDITPGETVELDTFYMENRRRFFGLMIAYSLVLFLQAALLGDPAPGNYVILALGLVIPVTLYRSSSWRVHGALTIVAVVLSLGGIAAYWSRIV